MDDKQSLEYDLALCELQLSLCEENVEWAGNIPHWTELIKECKIELDKLEEITK